MDLNQTKPKPKPRSRTNEITLRGRSVWIDETGEITGKKGTRYSEVSTTIPFGTGWITAPTIDENGNKLSDEEVKQRLKDNQGKDFITGEKLPVFSSEEKASEYAQWRSNTMFDKEAIKEGFPEETFPGLPEDKKEEDKEGQTSLKGFMEYLMTPSRHFGTGQYNEGGMAEQMEMFGYTDEGVQQEAEKFVDKDAAPAKDITFMDAAKFVAELTPVIGDAMAAKEVYDELQKDDPNYFLAGALGGAAIIGLVPGIGDAAASAIRAGARKSLDVAKRVEVDPDAVGAMGGNIRLKPKEEVTPQLSNIEYQRKMAEFDKAETVDDWQENVRKYVEESRDVNPTIRTPELEDSTKDLLDNKITREQHLANVDNYKPVDAWDALPREPSSKAVVFSLNKEQRKDGHFVLDNASSMGINKSSLKIGDLFNGRLDIPAYNRFDTWIVTGSSKNAEKGKHYAKAIHYTAGEGEPVKFISSIKTSEKIGTGEKGKTPYATVQGYIKDLDINEIRNKATQYLNDPEWTQVGFDPRRQGGFYVRAGENKHVPVREASEVIQIGPLVLAKNAKLDMDYTGFNEGGAVMDDQMKMAFMDEGGIADDGMDVDPVSGNEVPPGSLAEEVRDDIPAQLSEGEYVVPADVVRYYGVKFFEDLRDQAKMGLADMEANGRIGGEPVPAGGPMNTEELSPEEMQAIQEMMGMSQGGAIGQLKQQQEVLEQPANKAVGNPQMMYGGGKVRGYQDSSLVTQAQSNLLGGQPQSQVEQQMLSASGNKPYTGQPLGFSLFGSSNTGVKQDQSQTSTFTPMVLYNKAGQSKSVSSEEEKAKAIADGYTMTLEQYNMYKSQSSGSGGSSSTVTTDDEDKEIKPWGQDLKDWNDVDDIKQFVAQAERGNLSRSGRFLKGAGFAIAGLPGALLAEAFQSFKGLNSLYDMEAAQIIAEAKGKAGSKEHADLAVEIQKGINTYLENAGGLVNLAYKPRSKNVINKVNGVFAGTGYEDVNSWAAGTRKTKRSQVPTISAKKKANIIASQNQANKGTSSGRAKAILKAKASGVSTETAKKLSGSQMKAGSDVGAGPGGTDITGPMNKGGLMTKGKKKK